MDMGGTMTSNGDWSHANWFNLPVKYIEEVEKVPKIQLWDARNKLEGNLKETEIATTKTGGTIDRPVNAE